MNMVLIIKVEFHFECGYHTIGYWNGSGSTFDLVIVMFSWVSQRYKDYKLGNILANNDDFEDLEVKGAVVAMVLG